MRTRRTHRLGLDETERLIAGDPSPHHAGLKNLLDAVRAPATAQELAGEKATVAAYTAHRKRAARTASRTTARRAIVPITTAVVLLACGGTAYAARAGNLPQEAQQHAHRLFSALGVPAPRTGPTAPAVNHPSPTPAPSITALRWCDAWRGGSPLSSADRRKLIDAAGAEKRVERYCDGLRRSASAPPGPGNTPPGSAPAPAGTRPSAGAGPPAPGAEATPAAPSPPTASAGESPPTPGQDPSSPLPVTPKYKVTER
jgi:hypothetical protein